MEIPKCLRGNGDTISGGHFLAVSSFVPGSFKQQLAIHMINFEYLCTSFISYLCNYRMPTAVRYRTFAFRAQWVEGTLATDHIVTSCSWRYEEKVRCCCC